MSDYKKLFLMIFAAYCVQFAHAVIPEIEVWTDGTHYRYLLKDWHTDYVDGRISIAQQRDILWALQQKLPHVFIIAEDQHVYDGLNKKVQKIYDGNSDLIKAKTIEEEVRCAQDMQHIKADEVQGSAAIMHGNLLTPLLCLLRRTREYGIRDYNAECDQVLSIYAIGIENPLSDKILAEEVLSELHDHINQIGKYKKLEAYYTHSITLFAELQQFVKNKEFETFLSKAYVLRSFLVDAKTLLKLVEWNDVIHGFVCEGVNHINNVRDNLGVLGYKHVKTVGFSTSSVKSFESEEDIDKCFLQNALDLRKTFIQIFAEQQSVIQPASFWLRHKAYLATGISAAIILGSMVWQYFHK